MNQPYSLVHVFRRVSRRIAVTATCTLGLLAGAVPLHAQPDAIGQIQRIRNTKGKESCRAPQQTRPGSVRLVRSRVAHLLEKLPPPEPLFLNDSIRVGGDFDARITIDDARYGLGDIVLAPRLLCQVVGADAQPGIAADTGIYTLSRRGDTLRFDVKAGGAYITWANAQKLCRLQIVVPTSTATICGTTVVVAVDAAGTHGVFHLAEGTVRIGNALASRGDVFLFATGQPPQRLPTARAANVIDQANVRFHSNTVWKAPSLLGRAFRNPWTYVGLAAAGTAAWYVTKDDNSPTNGKKKIVLRIPI